MVINSVSGTIKNEGKEQNEGYFRMLVGTLGARLLVNLSTGKGAIAASHGGGTTRAGQGTIRASQNF